MNDISFEKNGDNNECIFKKKYIFNAEKTISTKGLKSLALNNEFKYGFYAI
jgi:hypothetical protein